MEDGTDDEDSIEDEVNACRAEIEGSISARLLGAGLLAEAQQAVAVAIAACAAK